MTAKLPNAETAHACCDHRRADGVNPCPDCLFEVDSEGNAIPRDTIARREYHGTKCAACNGRKRPEESFCKRCYGKLNKALIPGLYKTFAEGYAHYYFLALDYLRADAAPKARRA